MSYKVSINSLNPRLEQFGPRALLAPQVIKSYLLSEDPSLDIIINEFFDEEDDKTILSEIINQGVNVISFSTYVWNVEKILTICRKIRKQKETLIVLGGPGASYSASEILTNCAWIDMIVVGEGEETFYKLLQKLKIGLLDFDGIPNLAYRCANQISHSEQVSVSLEKHTHQLEVSSWENCTRICYETSRGCIMKCKFCLWYKGEERRIRFYPIDKVKSDLANIFDLPQLKMLEFVDADINMKRRRALEIFQHVRQLNDQREKRGLERVFLLYESNPEMMSDEIIDEMAKHDKVIDFGLQTIDETLHYETLGRLFHKERYFNTLEKLIKTPSNRHSEYMLEIIYGLPKDTLQGFRDTINYILSLPYLMYFWSFRFLVMPGTIFHKEADLYEAVFNPRPPYELICSSSWSQDDFEEAQFLSFYFSLIQFGLPEVYDAVKEQSHGDKLSTFERIFKHISRNDKVINNLYNECKGPGREVYQFQRCTAFSTDPLYRELRHSLIQDSLALIDSC